MKRIVLIIALLLPASLSAQKPETADSAMVIILSPRVGAEIDAEEAAEYHVFGQFTGFLWGEFFLVNGNEYVLHAVLVDRSGAQRDTLVPFPHQLVILLAEKIDHIEELKNGTYHLRGEEMTFPTIVVSRPTGVLWTAAHAPQTSDSLRTALPQKSPLRTYPATVPPMQDELPFAGLSADDGRSQIHYPNFGFGIGYGFFDIKLDGLTGALGAALLPYQSQTTPSTTSENDSRTGPMTWGHIQVRISPSITVRGEVGYAVGPEGFTYNVVLGAVEYNFLPLSLVRPYVGIGFGNYHFELTRRYDWIVSRDQNNGYTTLDGITLRGSRLGFVIRCGIELFPLQMPGLDLCACYSMVSPIDITSGAIGPTSISISGFTIVLRGTFTL